MISQAHEEIVEDIREILNYAYIRPSNPPFKVSFATDAFLGNPMMGLPDGNGVRADFYIFPDDGGGAIPVEVGRNHYYKWENMKFPDGQPIRVLYVSFERGYNLTHQIGTDFEHDMLAQLKQLQSKTI